MTLDSAVQLVDKFMTVEIEMHELPDGRRYITDTQCMERPEIMEFIKHFPNYWERDPIADIWVSPTIDVSPVSKQMMREG